MNPSSLTFELPQAGSTESAEARSESLRLYEEHYESCYRFLILSGCSADECLDLLQEGFLRLHQSLRNGGRIENPKSWLIRVIHRLRIDEFRRSSRMSCFGDFPDHIWDHHVATESSPERAALDRERIEKLRAAVRGLTPTQRGYLMLRAEGLKFREIAELHGVTVGSVFDACARALRTIGKQRNA
jgi:RNA polymerase sigma-70 factor (ECF subfamily)